jgi:hypothetical protein
MYETYKIVYTLRHQNNGQKGVALVEAYSWNHAMTTFQEEYAGQFFTIESCKKLFE